MGVGTLAGVETEKIIEMREDIASIKSILSTMANTNNMALEALQSSRAAHKRLDGIDKVIFWAGSTVIGCLIVGAITLLYKSQGGN